MDVVTLRRKLLGRNFLFKIERLDIAFASATSPFHAEIKRVEKEEAAFQKKVDAGGAAWERTTDDSDHYDYGEGLADRRDDAIEALLTLRKAFTFLIYHQWERLAQYWTTPGKIQNHAELVKTAKAAGVPLDEPSLETLRLLVNTLKHNSSRC